MPLYAGKTPSFQHVNELVGGREAGGISKGLSSTLFPKRAEESGPGEEAHTERMHTLVLG